MRSSAIASPWAKIALSASIGAAIGFAVAGPIGGVIGAVVGGVIGWLAPKLLDGKSKPKPAAKSAKAA